MRRFAVGLLVSVALLTGCSTTEPITTVDPVTAGGPLGPFGPFGPFGGPLGFIYSHTIEPLSTNFHRTSVAREHAAGDVKQVDYSYLRVVWSGNAIGEIAKQHGFDEVYYADLERLRVLGIWTQEWVHIYGTRKPVAP